MKATDPQQLEAYRVGDKDDKGALITRIYVKNTNHLIYEVNGSGQIGLMMQNPQSYNWKAISPFTARISTLLNSVDERKAFLPNLARAYHDFFSHNIESAVALLKSMETDIEHHKRVRGKLNYLFTCLIVVGALGLFGATYHISGLENIFPEWRMYINSTILGGFGGFLSVSLHVNQLKLDLQGSNLLPRVTAVTRIMIAVMSSLIALILIRSNLVAGVLNDATNPNAVYALVVLAGFSESFIPNVLNRIEAREQDGASE